jgi:hypothetical protein
MSLVFNQDEARKADATNGSIRESGMYVGIITRAEKLISEKGTEGVGFSFKTDDGSTANYLDIYTKKENGEPLRGLSIVQAVLCCTRTREAQEGSITFDKYDINSKKMVKATANGYPDLIGKRVGFVLQKELSTNTKTGKDTERLNVYAVFEAGTNLVSSEILDKKTQPEQLDKIVANLMRNPLRDTRTAKTLNSLGHAVPAESAGFDDLDNDLPF